MMKILYRAIIIAITMLNLSPGVAQDGKSSMKLEIYGFSNDEGTARILVFNGENKNSFPKGIAKAYIKRVVPIKNNKVIIEFKDLPNGEYAVSVHHDENNDGMVNTNFLGIPTEGFGATNDAKGNFGPPSFDKAKISLNNQHNTFKIRIVN